MRLGLCVVNGLNSRKARGAVRRAKASSRGISLEDFKRRAQLDQGSFRTLAEIGALNPLTHIAARRCGR